MLILFSHVALISGKSRTVGLLFEYRNFLFLLDLKCPVTNERVKTLSSLWGL